MTGVPKQPSQDPREIRTQLRRSLEQRVDAESCSLCVATRQTTPLFNAKGKVGLEAKHRRLILWPHFAYSDEAGAQSAAFKNRAFPKK